jgi:hypothetical protein
LATQLTGILLVSGFVVLAASALVGVPGLYGAGSIDAQLELIRAHRRRWLATQALVTLYLVLAGAGFVALAVELAPDAGSWVPAVAALAVVAGSLSGLYFVFLQTTDPRGGYSSKYPLPEAAAYWLWLGGVLLFGVAWLLAGPAWLGALTVAGSVAFTALFLVTGKGFATPALTALVGLVAGLALLLQ